MTRQPAAQLIAAALFCASAACGNAQAGSSPPLDANALVRHAVQQRLEESQSSHPLQYQIRRVDERHDSTKVIVETPNGDVARLIAINGKPLIAEVNQAELDRLDNLAAHPELQERRRKSEDKERDRISHLLGMLPDAFLYTSNGTTACDAGRCYRLRFAPNPRWTPPDLEANVFRGLAGELWIDQSQERLVRLDGHFIADVDFGLGFIGRLNKGGTVLLQQSNVGDNDWELTGLTVHVSGKAFIFKGFTYEVSEQASHFTPAPSGRDYRDAINLLKKLDIADRAQ